MPSWTTRGLGARSTNLDRRRVPVRSSDRRPGPYPYYGASGVVDHVDSFLFDGLHLLVAEDGENLRSRKTPVAFLANGKFWVNNHAHILTANKENDTRFLAYALEAMDISGYITGSVQPKLTQAALASIRVCAPAREEQLGIAATLGALDDKIESNRRLADLIMSLCNAEFSRRFGDRPLTLPLSSLASVVDCLHSKKPSRVASGPRLMQLNNIRDDGLVDPSETYAITGADYRQWSQKFESQEWDCVITNVGRIGAVARIPSNFTAALGRNMTGIRPTSPRGDGAFLATALISPAVQREIELRTDSGTIMNSLNVRSIPHLRLPESSASDRADFHQLASTLLARADHAIAESLMLASTRDDLLPLLLCGRISVLEAREVVVEAVG